MKRLPIGIQNIREIITGDYVYADKTQYVYNIITDAKYYFLSRPRRFGKSLLLDTIGEVFLGNKELFKGLWIYNSGYDFEKHPVIRLDMSNIANKTSEVLEESIMSYLELCYNTEEFDIKDKIPSDAFRRLIVLLNKKYNKRVVVLIDEYDKPILDHIDNLETAEANRKAIKAVYGILKSMDPYLRFTFFTGVSKFTKTSMFSELNNLNDISMREDYANICGIPAESLDEYFGEHIKSLKEHKRFKDYGNLRDLILAWYDGYSWDGNTRLLNPFSLLNFFDHKKFYGFWYSSGTPKFLMEYIKRQPKEYTDFKGSKITEDMLDSVDIDKIMLGSMLFQTGYLTVKEIPPTMYAPIYIMDFPNYEVRDAFNLHILAALTDKDAEQTGRARMRIIDALEAGDLQTMLEIMRGLFASIPYNLQIEKEAYYHSIFYAVMNVLGFEIEAEVSVSKGRADAVVQAGGNVYVIEFKYEFCEPDADDEHKRKLFDKALKDGMEQINSREYHKKFIGSGKNIHKVAFALLGKDDIEMQVR